MATHRKKPPVDIVALVLHESAYMCAKPGCRAVLTLDIHHIVYVSEGGKNTPENLLPLCGYCHDLHHKGYIPAEAVRAWKMLLLSMNEGFDRASVNMLLALDAVKSLRVSPDAILTVAALIASRLVTATFDPPANQRYQGLTYVLALSDRGRAFVEGWKDGDQRRALGSGPVVPQA